MAELAAQWRDAWKQLSKNPLLLLLILLAIVGIAEGAARLIEFISGTSVLKLDFILRAAAFSVLGFGIGLAICILAALAALFVVVRAGTFFAVGQSVALGRFAWRVALAWLILLVMPNLIGAAAGVLLSVSRFSEPALGAWPLFSWILPVLYAAVQAALASILLSRLPAIAFRNPLSGASRNDKMRRRNLLRSYLLLFGLSTVIQFAFWSMHGDSSALVNGYRVNAILMACQAFWATLLAFVVHERVAARDPSLVAVFD